MRWLGPAQLDILDSLRAGPLTTLDLVDETGRAQKLLLASLGRLRRHGLVESSGRRHGLWGSISWMWRITPLGRAEYERRVRRVEVTRG